MTEPALWSVVEVLGGQEGREVFSAAPTAPGTDLRLEVRGVGPIELPASEAQTRKLCEVARPARYGHGELSERPHDDGYHRRSESDP